MPCAIFGCGREARNNFSVRLRRPDTRAIWAPNTEAFLCDEHAASGLRINVILEPTDTGEIETRVSSMSAVVFERVTPIVKDP
jgi:hypothetical protein